MKKLRMLVLSVVLVISLTACNIAEKQKEDSISESYAVGDIILVDGSIVKAAELMTVDRKNCPMAVIAGFTDDGKTVGVGVHRSDSPLQWEADDADGEERFPALEFVNAYAETYQLTGDYASNWCIPNIEELRIVYENRETINDSLETIHELDDQAAMNGLDTNWYWSSTQSDSEEDYAWFIHFFNGYAGECPKNFTNVHALAIRLL